MTAPDKKQLLREIEAAEGSLRSAQALLKIGELRDAVSRAYYCVFHAARAFLWKKGLAPKTHKGVQQLFHEHVVKEKIVSESIGDILKDLADDRRVADYLTMSETLRDEDVKIHVTEAGRFLDCMRDLVEERWP